MTVHCFRFLGDSVDIISVHKYGMNSRQEASSLSSTIHSAAHVPPLLLFNIWHPAKIAKDMKATSMASGCEADIELST